MLAGDVAPVRTNTGFVLAGDGGGEFDVRRCPITGNLCILKRRWARDAVAGGGGGIGTVAGPAASRDAGAAGRRARERRKAERIRRHGATIGGPGPAGSTSTARATARRRFRTEEREAPGEIPLPTMARRGGGGAGWFGGGGGGAGSWELEVPACAAEAGFEHAAPWSPGRRPQATGGETSSVRLPDLQRAGSDDDSNPRTATWNRPADVETDSASFSGEEQSNRDRSPSR